ncbi:hypothetical protein KY366_07760 [Candidatus Woesearchaeota archaeon]|nr:hypothetical protein [Candidatus Woesearchaeota archaeon]
METDKHILTILLKDISTTHTATSLSKHLKMSRWGTWKILKRLAEDELIIFNKIGSGKTGTQSIMLNWDNVLLEKVLAFSLTQEALKYRRWRYNFSDLEKEVDFLILHGSILHFPKEANDIDLIGIVNKKKLAKIDTILLRIQQTQIKKIHAIQFIKKEFKRELKSKNQAFIDALKKGIILFGQENFIKFIRELQK